MNEQNSNGCFLRVSISVPFVYNVKALYMWLWVLAVVVVNTLPSNASYPIMGLLIGSQQSAWLVL